MKKAERIIIVGGGLSGLTLAYFLTKENLKPTILEASPRLGGRIQTINGKLGTPLEMGATWFSDMHQNFLEMLDELDLNKYPQFSEGKSLFQTNSFEPPQEFYMPASERPSYRLAGGAQAITDALYQKLDGIDISLNTKVSSIHQKEDELVVETNTEEKFNADKVILCLPPQLVGSQIRFSPKLPEGISSLLPTVQTWMAGSIKFAIEYAAPFWRNKGYSGMLYSHTGIISEMYDHLNYEETKFGFIGFLNGGTATWTQEKRKDFVSSQLKELLGEESVNAIAYYDKVWTDEYILDNNPIVNLPHQNNGHPLLQESYMDGKLFFSGTEASPEFPGYMEGAIISAKNVFQKLVG